MDPKQIAQSTWDQFITVANAPVPFLASLIASWFIIRWFIRGHFETRLANAQSTVEMLEKKIDRWEVIETVARRDATSGHAKMTAAAPAPPKARRPSLPDRPKVYVHETHTANYLVGVFDGRTELVATRMLESEIGKWIKVEAEIGAVSPVVHEVVVGLRLSATRFAFCYFPEGTPGLERLCPGQTTAIEGQIELIQGLGITLVNCTFIGSASRSSASAVSPTRP